jgi:hypothetical protein
VAWELSFDSMDFGESSAIVKELPPSCRLEMVKVELSTHGSLTFGGVSKIVVRSLALYNRNPP